jgi:urease accessory protein
MVGNDHALADRVADMQFSACSRLPRGEQPMRIALTIIAALLLLPTAAFAHPAIGDAHGFVQGLAHPLGGLDHILAMVAVGVFAWQLGGRALWAVPTTFVLVMALGGILGITGVAVPGVEIGIAASVIVLGAIVAFRVKASVALAMGLVALFAIFHGHAHGTEMPLAAVSVPYGFGFMFATMLLHLAGIALGFAIGRAGESYGRLGYRFAGGLVALAGIAILAQAI